MQLAAPATCWFLHISGLAHGKFAFVAVVGLKKDIFPYTNTELTTEELKISLAQQKRLFYVACSRAIQNLAVYTSKDTPSKLAEDLREPYWIREGAFNI